MSDVPSPPVEPTPDSPTPSPTPTPTPPAETPSTPEQPGKEPESVLGTAPPEPFDPEKVTFPEGFTKDEAFFDDFKNIAAEHGLTGPAAQKLVDLAAKQTKAVNDTLLAQWDKQQQDWQTEIKADKEIG